MLLQPGARDESYWKNVPGSEKRGWS